MDAPLANATVDAALSDAIARFVDNNPRSRAQHETASAVMPGGNTRTVLFHEPFPLTLTGGKGCHVTSLDGVTYLDALGEYTAGIFGHSDATIRAAIDRALDGGLVLGGHTETEARFAEALCRRFPALEMVRFTNSGTEANLLALSLARAVTERSTIMVVKGGYHGSVLTFSVESPLTVPFPVVFMRYNDLASAREAAASAGDDLAAIILEPMMGSGGCIPASVAFLEGLKDLAAQTGALLIFDEVMTSRLAPGGLQERHGVTPDLMTLGKYVGGGMSFGAFGGRADVMAHLDPHRPGAFAHAGTFNNNVLTMNAGLAAMTEVYTPEAARWHNERGDALRERLNAICREAGADMQFTGIGSMLTVHMTARPIPDYETRAAHSDARLVELFFFDMLEAGVWIARRGMINLSLPMGKAEEDRLAEAVEGFVESRRSLLTERGR